VLYAEDNELANREPKQAKFLNTKFACYLRGLYTGQIMILVVEDDPTSSRVVTAALKTAGHEVMNAGNGAEALELLAMQNFELVITDLVMPNLNGLNLIKTIRLKWPHMPLILMSGYLSKEAGKAIVDETAAFLQKPMNPTTLIMTVERVLAKSK
jgi:DNA-binding NtrC family response regulator